MGCQRYSLTCSWRGGIRTLTQVSKTGNHNMLWVSAAGFPPQRFLFHKIPQPAPQTPTGRVVLWHEYHIWGLWSPAHSFASEKTSI